MRSLSRLVGGVRGRERGIGGTFVLCTGSPS